ncbi:hypothetical protein MRX96_006409 [Rhipicephalus microplus]
MNSLLVPDAIAMWRSDKDDAWLVRETHFDLCRADLRASVQDISTLSELASLSLAALHRCASFVWFPLQSSAIRRLLRLSCRLLPARAPAASSCALAPLPASVVCLRHPTRTVLSHCRLRGIGTCTVPKRENVNDVTTSWLRRDDESFLEGCSSFVSPAFGV